MACPMVALSALPRSSLVKSWNWGIHGCLHMNRCQQMGAGEWTDKLSLQFIYFCSYHVPVYQWKETISLICRQTNLDSFSTYKWLFLHHGDFCEVAASFTRVLSPFLSHQYFKMFNWNKYAIFHHRSIHLIFMFLFPPIFQFCLCFDRTAMVKCVYASFPDRPFLTFPGLASLYSSTDGLRNETLKECANCRNGASLLNNDFGIHRLHVAAHHI